MFKVASVLCRPGRGLLCSGSRRAIHTTQCTRLFQTEYNPNTIIFLYLLFCASSFPENEVTRSFLLGTSGEVNIEKAVGGIAVSGCVMWKGKIELEYIEFGRNFSCQRDDLVLLLEYSLEV